MAAAMAGIHAGISGQIFTGGIDATQCSSGLRSDGSRPGPSGIRLSEFTSGMHGHRLKSASLKTGRRSIRLGGIRANSEKANDVEVVDIESSQKLALALSQQNSDVLARIASGEFTVASRRVDRFGKARRSIAATGPPGRALAMAMATIERKWRSMNPVIMPEARGDVRSIIGQPFFVPLYSLFLVYGGVFKLSFGPKNFAIVSDPAVAKYILKDNAKGYSKGILSEILDFVMGKGLIPADGEIWRVRRRAIVPSLHKQYVAAMVELFGSASLRLCDKVNEAAGRKETVELESLFSRLTLDVIGKAVFNYEFDSLSKDTGVIEAVYVALREAESRSTALFPYWKIPPLRAVLPGQRKVAEALKLINATLDELIASCKRMVLEEDDEFHEEYVSKRDPSILHFLLASGDEVSSQQLRDDLMTLLIAGHETSAAVLTWTFHLLSQNLEVTKKLQHEVDELLGDRHPTIDDLRKLKYTTRVINEAMRLYPQPPVLIRRALEDDRIGGFPIKQGQDIFISVWNLHRNPEVWERADDFWPERWPVNGPDPNETTENFSYLPFGGGPRKCVGDIFALYENVTAVAMLARRFNFQPVPGAPPVGMTTGATIHTTDGLVMNVIRRSNSAPPAVLSQQPAAELEKVGTAVAH
eukprot:jgi/Mesen1/5760/ME000292S04845